MVTNEKFSFNYISFCVSFLHTILYVIKCYVLQLGEPVTVLETKTLYLPGFLRIYKCLGLDIKVYFKQITNDFIKH